MINEINLEIEGFKNYECPQLDDRNAITNLSRVNVFIGPNNSGKSRFLRTLFSDKNFQFYSSDFDANKINNCVSVIMDLKDVLKEKSGLRFSYSGAEEEFDNNWTTIPYIKINQEVSSFFPNYKSRIDMAWHKIIFTKRDFDDVIAEKYGEFNKAWTDLYDEIKKNLSVDFKTRYKRYYIPMLRGLRPIQLLDEGKVFDSTKDPYLYRTVIDYFVGRDKKNKSTGEPLEEIIVNSIFTGFEIYEDIKSKLLDTKDKRQRIADFEKFLKENFFPDKDISLIPKIGEDVIMVGFNSTDEKLIYELGDGIQAIIQMLYPIFMRKGEDALFFIEEPELSLHPGMQRLLLKTLLRDEFKSMQFFFTTHSNHFLDITEDTGNVSIYSFKKTPEGKFQIRSMEDSTHHVLSDIGVRNSSVFLANCSIWVEGITERKYLRKFLEVYNNSKAGGDIKYIEDLHYTFVEYGGSNIVHWDFEGKDADETDKINALRVNNKIFLIVDSDIQSNGDKAAAKVARHKKLKEILEDDFYITEGKEIENILTPAVILRVIQDYEGLETAPDVKGLYKTVKGNSGNTGIEINKPVYWNQNLGAFIDKNHKEKKRNYVKDNSLSDKTNFCNKAVKNITSIDDLSEEAKLLCGKIMDFIKRNNR